MRQLTINLDLPEDATSEQLTDSVIWAVKIWRGVLEEYKAKGIKVPVLSIKAPVKAKDAPQAAEYKEFTNKLLDYHLQFMPNADVAAQRMAIKKLFETGIPAEELISLYDKSRAEYKLTSWFTVASRLAKNAESKTEQEFERVNLDADQQEELKKRLKQNVSTN